MSKGLEGAARPVDPAVMKSLDPGFLPLSDRNGQQRVERGAIERKYKESIQNQLTGK